MINTIKHLCYVLRTTEKKIIKIMSNTDAYYRSFQQPKRKHGGPQINDDGTYRMRKIDPSIGELKKLQQRINMLLQKCYMPDYAFGCVKGRDNVANAKMHSKNAYFLSIDLRDFFPNINHHQVFQTFRAYGFSPIVSRVLTKLTTYKNGLPQGAPTSPIIANLVFATTGRDIERLASANRLTFTTFLDDLTLSANKNFKPLANDVLNLVKAGRFKLHHGKVSYKKHEPEVTGIIIKDGKMTLPSSMMTRAKTNPAVMSYWERVNKANDKKPVR